MYMYIPNSACIHVCVWSHTHERTFIYTHINIYIYTHTMRVLIHIYIYILIYLWLCYNVASILVNPTAAANIIWPTPQKSAYNGSICRLDARYTNAMAALLTTPELNGANVPITRIIIGKNLPKWCFLSVVKAIIAAIVWTNTDENNAHRNTWYHISANVISGVLSAKPITLIIVSKSVRLLPSLDILLTEKTLGDRYSSHWFHFASGWSHVLYPVCTTRLITINSLNVHCLPRSSLILAHLINLTMSCHFCLVSHFENGHL